MNTQPVGTPVMNATVGISAVRYVRIGESARPNSWLGRVRVGDDVTLRLQAVGPDGFSLTGVAWPQAPPVARIYANVASPTALLVPIDDTSGGAVGNFRGRFTPGSVNPPGRYFALASYLVGGHVRCHLAPFEVVPGGHPSSSVLSMFHFDLPAGSVFIAHQRSGRVTTGLRPYLDPGD